MKMKIIVLALVMTTFFACKTNYSSNEKSAADSSFQKHDRYEAEEHEHSNMPSHWEAPAWTDSIKNPLERNKNSTEKGREIFQQYCVTCHGEQGKGDGPAAANITPKPFDLTSGHTLHHPDGQLQWKIMTGKGPMPSLKSFYTGKDSVEVSWGLVNYIRYLQNKNQ